MIIIIQYTRYTRCATCTYYTSYMYACGCVGNNLRRTAPEHDSPYRGFFPAGEKPRARTQSVSCHRPGNPFDRLIVTPRFLFFATLARNSSSYRSDQNCFSRVFSARNTHCVLLIFCDRNPTRCRV